MNITSLETIYASIPDVQNINGELHSPCPFCKPTANSRVTEYKGVEFVGDDRFFWQANRRQFYCRHCGRHAIEEVAKRLFGEATISSEFIDSLPQIKAVKHELVLYGEKYIEEQHKRVQYSYWNAFGWPNEVIDKFKLGYGRLYPGVIAAQRHIIPFVPRTAQREELGYALEGRLERPYANEGKNVKTAGLTSEYFTEIVEGPAIEAVICEGIKDGISAYVLGFRHIYCFLGNATDLQSFSEYINSKPYSRLILFTHNDDAGEKYKAKLFEHLTSACFSVLWPGSAKKGYDLTNLLEDYRELAKSYVHQNLAEVLPDISKGYIPDVRIYQPDYSAPEKANATSRDLVRQELPEVLQDFIDHYSEKRRMAGRGIVKVLASDPGSGKSYALVQMAEFLARRAIHEFKIERRALHTLIDDLTQELAFIFDSEALEEHRARIANFQKRYDNLSCATVLYAGPFINGWQDILDQGADESLWYNYEARNEENCENLQAVSQLALKGYVPMAYCQSVCPLKAHCEVHGYLSQEAERRAKPITYVRHQQLVTTMVQEYKYIIIDENCLNVFDTPISVSASQLIPTYPYWDTYVEHDQVKLILELVEALRQVLLNADENITYSGREVMQLLDAQLLGKSIEILEKIDPKNILEFQPKTVMQGINMQTAPIRCLPSIYNVLMDELDLYQGKELNYNSGLHIVENQLEIYDLQRLHIPSSRPIIVSDGTPLPELYGYLFDREVEVYGPNVYNPDSQTVVYCGSDFTITSIRKQLGDGLRDFQKWLDDAQKNVTDIFGEDFDLDSIPFDENLYNSSILKRCVSLIKMCAEKHNSLLFVTYKPIRIILERRVRELYPELAQKIHFAHYWSLRGTNKYKDIEAVLLIGCPRIPYDSLYRKIQAWGKLAMISWISPKTQMLISAFSGENRYDGYAHIGFTENFANELLNMVEIGEIRQSMERIRQHTSEIPKTAYIAASRPAAKWVTSVSRVGESVNDYENDSFRNAYAYMQSSYLTNKAFPSYSDVNEKFHLGNSKISKIKRSILDGDSNSDLPS